MDYVTQALSLSLNTHKHSFFHLCTPTFIHTFIPFMDPFSYSSKHFHVPFLFIFSSIEFLTFILYFHYLLLFTHFYAFTFSTIVFLRSNSSKDFVSFGLFHELFRVLALPCTQYFALAPRHTLHMYSLSHTFHAGHSPSLSLAFTLLRQRLLRTQIQDEG